MILRLMVHYAGLFALRGAGIEATRSDELSGDSGTNLETFINQDNGQKETTLPEYSSFTGIASNFAEHAKALSNHVYQDA